MRPIRVMHVVRSMATGGTENVVRRLLSQLDANRFEQRVCSLISAPGKEPASTVCLRHRDGPSFLVPSLTRAFLRQQPDVVHSRNWGTIEAVFAARLAGVGGVIHSEHGRDLGTMGPQPWRRRKLRGIAYRLSDRVFCVSEELRDYYSREAGLPAIKFDVILNGVDTAQYHEDAQARARKRELIGAGAGTFVIGTVGRLDPVKDHPTLLRATETALARGLDLRLVIVGDGTERNNLEQILSSKPALSRHTVLVGESQDVNEWLNCFDVFVLPSLSEGISNTLLEAMAVGLAPIATRVGGNPEVIQHERSGLLVDANDVEGIAGYIRDLAANEGWRRELGRNARQRIVSRFSMDRMVRQYEEMYWQLTAPKRLRSAAFSRA